MLLSRGAVRGAEGPFLRGALDNDAIWVCAPRANESHGGSLERILPDHQALFSSCPWTFADTDQEWRLRRGI
eukprot:6646532-Prorocentrum_lima.AAC.1